MLWKSRDPSEILCPSHEKILLQYSTKLIQPRLRPVLAFISETREYVAGKLRRGETISGREVARLILSFAKLVPSCVKQVIVRMDAEMYSWAAVKACLRRGYEYIISAKRTRPPFDPKGMFSKHFLFDLNFIALKR